MIDLATAQAPNASAMACSVCASRRLRPAFRKNGYDIHRCLDCGHVFVWRLGPETELDAEYDENYYRSDAENTSGYRDYLAKSEARLRAFADRLDWIEGACDGRGAIIDYGCAVGLFVKVARDRGWAARGYERSRWAVEYGRSVVGVDIALGDGSSDPFAPSSVDAVTLWDVLEHVQAPSRTLELAHRWLKPGGVLALTTVNISSLGARLASENWRHLMPPHHLQFFSRRSLLHLLATAGFHVRVLRASGTFLTSRSAPSGAGGNVAHAIDRIAGHWRARPIAQALNLLDEIEILAVKGTV
jgi:2-polyprenyl-3-methyl-5-hydroxy-6-metoxy-1,4-benzoquinol methylase